jgi:hypothetical protein
VPDRSWGVRLERVGRAVVVAPSGELSGDSLERLREVLAPYRHRRSHRARR